MSAKNWLLRRVDQLVSQLEQFSRSKKYLDLVLGDKDIKELIKWSGVVLMFHALGLPLWLLTSLIISRWYGADAMWLYGLVITIVWILISLGLVWLEAAMPRFLGEARAIKSGQESAIYRTSIRLIVVTWFVCSVGLYVCAASIAQWIFYEPKLTFPLQVSSVFLIPLMIQKYNEAFLIGSKKIYHSELVSKALIPITMFLIVFVSYWIWPTYYIPIWWYLLTWALGMVVSMYLLRKHKYVAIRGDLFDWKQITKVSGPMIALAISLLVMQYTDVLMLGHILDTSSVWVYKVIASLAYLVIIPYAIINMILSPKISELYRSSNKKALQHSILISWKLISYSATGIAVVLLLVGPYILWIFWSEFLVWVIPMYILICNQYINAITATNGAYMNTTGKEKIFAVALIVVALINICTNYILIPMYGLEWAAIATSISLVCFNIRWVRYIWRQDKIMTCII